MSFPEARRNITRRMTLPDLCVTKEQHYVFPEPHTRPKPIKLWSASTPLNKEASKQEADRRITASPEAMGTEQQPNRQSPDAAETPTWSRFRRMSLSNLPTISQEKKPSVNYLVAGLDVDYPEELLKPYQIAPAVWRRFIQAMNAALSEFPSWKDPRELTAARDHRFSFDAGLSAASGATSLWMDETMGERGRHRAERVLQWWNDDYFAAQGCNVRLGFRRDEIAGPRDENVVDAADRAPTSEASDTTSTAADTIVSTLKPFLTVRPI